MKTFRKKLLEKSPAKAQSAMEYLMTYGWAILIIAVVLAALFQLGVFNPMAFAPKAQPGSCQVFRPNGPGTTSFINLEGVCSGELPQYVAQFNGQNIITVPAPAELPIGSSPRTITAWVDPSGSSYWVIFYGVTQPNYTSALTIASGGNVDFVGWVDGWESPLTVKNNTWNFIAVTYSGGTSIAAFSNGQYATGSIGPLTTPLTNLYIGGLYGYGPSYYKGLIANVQIYNTSLSANEIQALYLEGIGGAPIDLQHLVTWWPLNGNANDYSGNGNNGQINNVNFVSNWYSSYTPP